MKKIRALYPLSANPWHIGHEHVYNTACNIFGKDAVMIGLAKNPDKGFDNSWMKRTLIPVTNNVVIIDGLVSEFCLDNNIEFLIRGVRSGYDLEYELNMSHWNMELGDDRVKTIFIPSPQELSHVSSSTIRELTKLNRIDDRALKYLNKDVYYRWLHKDEKCGTIYFGESGVGKSTYLQKIYSKLIDLDKELLMHCSRPIKSTQDQLKKCIKENDVAQFKNIVQSIGENTNWNFLESYIDIALDAAALGVYYKHIPKEILGKFNLIKLKCQEFTRIDRLRSRGKDSYKKSVFFNEVYEDFPYWDKEIDLTFQ